ncbi:hypothetical protein [Streptomyces sp. NRRL WC-3742]|uniref:hypothetical protein n=1 Tax=Streptomyces sp. NRRL WC-3742 TaxID=1463934 RepID=UPI00131E6CB3|nr:hypothetical protein [Streptomyces sp. NRRL WC-3742]
MSQEMEETTTDLRQEAATSRSVDHLSTADAALGEADAARGRAAEAAARRDLGTAGAEWSDAAGLDGQAAANVDMAAVEARAEAAVTTSTTVQATAARGPAPGSSATPAPQGRAPAPAPAAAPRRTR